MHSDGQRHGRFTSRLTRGGSSALRKGLRHGSLDIGRNAVHQVFNGSFAMIECSTHAELNLRAFESHLANLVDLRLHSARNRSGNCSNGSRGRGRGRGRCWCGGR